MTAFHDSRVDGLFYEGLILGYGGGGNQLINHIRKIERKCRHMTSLSSTTSNSTSICIFAMYRFQKIVVISGTSGQTCAMHGCEEQNMCNGEGKVATCDEGYHESGLCRRGTFSCLPLAACMRNFGASLVKNMQLGDSLFPIGAR